MQSEIRESNSEGKEAARRVRIRSQTHLKLVSLDNWDGTEPVSMFELISRYEAPTSRDSADGRVPHNRLLCRSMNVRVLKFVNSVQSLVLIALDASDRYLEQGMLCSITTWILWLLHYIADASLALIEHESACNIRFKNVLKLSEGLQKCNRRPVERIHARIKVSADTRHNRTTILTEASSHNDTPQSVLR